MSRVVGWLTTRIAAGGTKPRPSRLLRNELLCTVGAMDQQQTQEGGEVTDLTKEPEGGGDAVVAGDCMGAGYTNAEGRGHRMLLQQPRRLLQQQPHRTLRVGVAGCCCCNRAGCCSSSPTER